MQQQQFPVQTGSNGLSESLARTTFVVVDLETTGSRPDDAGVTEIGAVRVRGGETLAEFSTLVNPGHPIPPFVMLLTGITDAMVAAAPAGESVLPDFLEFARDGVLVAHNAPFDVGFLKRLCAAHGHVWPAPPVLDTVSLARRAVTRREVPNHKLGSLATFFGVSQTPTHRALDDARATAGVLYGLLDRLSAFGVRTLEDVRSLTNAPTAAQRRKRDLADTVPATPGVYVFEDAHGAALYVGKSTNLRKRVRSYFTASEKRGRIREMIGLAERVTPIACETPLEAEVRELRAIAERKPAYNRRSRDPERALWLTLTHEDFPRLVLVHTIEGAAPAIGPFRSARQAELAREALYRAVPLRQCAHPITAEGRACGLAQIGRCGAPCEGGESVADYAVHVARARDAMLHDAAPVVEAVTDRITLLSRQLRYEEAAVHRDRLAAFLRAAGTAQRLMGLTSCPHLVAARHRPEGWEVCVVRHGRLAASGTMALDTADPGAYLRSLVAGAETVPPGDGPAPRAVPEETERILGWLDTPGVRLVELEGTWTSPVGSAQKYGELRDWHRGKHPAE